MESLDRLLQSQSEFFEEFGQEVPDFEFKIYDDRDKYWSYIKEGCFAKIKIIKLNQNGYHIASEPWVNIYRKDKGGLYTTASNTIFKVQYSLNNVEHGFFRVMSNDLFIRDYEDILDALDIIIATK